VIPRRFQSIGSFRARKPSAAAAAGLLERARSARPTPGIPGLAAAGVVAALGLGAAAAWRRRPGRSLAGGSPW
jgi:hypothetical protein